MRNSLKILCGEAIKTIDWIQQLTELSVYLPIFGLHSPNINFIEGHLQSISSYFFRNNDLMDNVQFFQSHVPWDGFSMPRGRFFILERDLLLTKFSEKPIKISQKTLF